MGRIIAAASVVRKVPYLMAESGHPLYSYEELCYYIKSRMALWIREENRPGLSDWLRDCGITIENIDYCSSVEAAEKIISAGVYYRNDERKEILFKMKGWEDLPEAEKEKECGDWYLYYGSLKKAWLSYARAAKSANEKEESWQCSFYHNYGLCCLKLFYFEEAKKWLSKALNIGNRKETKEALYIALEMRRTKWMTGEEPVKPLLLEKKKQEFINEL